MVTWIGSGDDGAFVDDDAAHVAFNDHGFTVGDGIFETMKVVDSRVFLWPWHRERLAQSAAVMGTALPKNLDRVVHETVAANETPGCHRLRLTISAGIGPLGSGRGASTPTVVCALAPAPQHPATARLHTASWPRNERSPLAGVKSTSYAENVLALVEARAAGASEALFLNTGGYVAECTGSNIFIVKGSGVITPPLGAGVLSGVTRRFVLSLRGEGIDFEERNVTVEELAAADEVFITSTFQDVRAVSAIDGVMRQPGPITKALAERFQSESARDIHWT